MPTKTTADSLATLVAGLRREVHKHVGRSKGCCTRLSLNWLCWAQLQLAGSHLFRICLRVPFGMFQFGLRHTKKSIAPTRTPAVPGRLRRRPGQRRLRRGLPGCASARTRSAAATTFRRLGAGPPVMVCWGGGDKRSHAIFLGGEPHQGYQDPLNLPLDLDTNKLRPDVCLRGCFMFAKSPTTRGEDSDKKMRLAQLRAPILRCQPTEGTSASVPQEPLGIWPPLPLKLMAPSEGKSSMHIDARFAQGGGRGFQVLTQNPEDDTPNGTLANGSND